MRSKKEIDDNINNLSKRLKIGMRICIADGWDCAGRTGRIMGLPIFVNQLWCPVLWDNEEDPDFYKASGLMEITNET